MPSVKNPNVTSKNRLAARAAKARKQQQKKASESKDRVAKADQKRGARAGILPTSGPNAALSSKKRRKLEKRMAHAMKRKMEAEGEVEMKDVPEQTAGEKKRGDQAPADQVDMVMDNIS